MDEWITPTLRRDDVTGDVDIMDPHPYPCIDGYDRLTVETADGPRCPATTTEHQRTCVCALGAGHVGPHWKADPEFADEIGVLNIAALLVSP